MVPQVGLGRACLIKGQPTPPVLPTGSFPKFGVVPLVEEEKKVLSPRLSTPISKRGEVVPVIDHNMSLTMQASTPREMGSLVVDYNRSFESPLALLGSKRYPYVDDSLVSPIVLPGSKVSQMIPLVQSSPFPLPDSKRVKMVPVLGNGSVQAGSRTLEVVPRFDSRNLNLSLSGSNLTMLGSL